MRPLVALMALAGFAAAQDADRVTVPFSNPGGPKRVVASVLNGSITVKAHPGQDVVVEAQPRESRGNRREPPQGMRRIVNTTSGLSVEESGNTITINTESHSRNVHLNINVPTGCSLKLSSVNNGGITVEGVTGDLDVSSLNGPVTLTNVGGTVVAHSLNGRVLVTLNQATPGKSMSFSTLNGAVDVTLPADVKANVKMKSENGEIFSDFDIQLQATSRNPTTEGGSGKGKYKVKFDRAMHGTINGGGPEFAFTTLNGTIYIRKK